MKANDYVTYDVALLLKDNGYNEPCKHYYRSDSKYLFESNYLLRNEMGYDSVYTTAPLLYDAQKWLRELHNLHIQINYEQSQLWGWTIYNMTIDSLEDTCSMYSSYEEALNEGIKEALRFI